MHSDFFLLFIFSTEFIPLPLFFTLIFQKIYRSWYYLCYIRVYGGCNIQLNQLIQPLVIIHFIHIRCYETDVADIVMHTALISLAVYEKGRENKKTSLQVTKYEAYSRTQRFPWVPTNQA